MEIHLSDGARLKRLPKKLKSQAEALGLVISLSQARELVAKMLGYGSWNLAVDKIPQTGEQGWDEDVKPAVRLARMKQYATALQNAGIAEDHSRSIAETMGISSRPERKHIEIIESIYAANGWGHLSRNDAARSMFIGDDQHVAFRRIESEDEIGQYGYAHATEVSEALRVNGACTLILAFESNGSHRMFGHVSYIQTVTEAGAHRIHVLSHRAEAYSDTETGEWTEWVGIQAVASEVEETDFWDTRTIPHDGVALVISPPLGQWERPSWALALAEALHAVIESDDENGRGNTDEARDWDRRHERYGEVRFDQERLPENRLPSVGTRIYGPDVANLLEAMGSLMFFVNLQRMKYLRVDPVARAVVALEEIDGALVPLDQEKGRAAKGENGENSVRAKQILDALTEGAVKELLSYRKKPFYVVGDWAVPVIVDVDRFHSKSWGAANRAFERLTAGKEGTSSKLRNDARAWETLFPHRLDEAFAERAGRAKLSRQFLPPHCEMLEPDSELEGVERWEFDDDGSFAEFEKIKMAVKAFTLPDSQLYRLGFPNNRLILRPHSLAAANWSKRASLMKAYQAADKFFIAEVFADRDAILSAARATSNGALGDWSGFRYWGEHWINNDQKRLMATLKFSDAPEPQAVVSYWRELSFSQEFDGNTMHYSVQIDGVYVGEDFRALGLGNAATLLVAQDIHADMAVFAKRLRRAVSTIGEPIQPRFYVHAATDNQAEESVAYRVVGYLEHALKLHLKKNELGRPHGNNGYVLADIG